MADDNPYKVNIVVSKLVNWEKDIKKEIDYENGLINQSKSI